jgi:hypothetical protein
MSGSFWQSLFSHQDAAALFCLFGAIVLVVAVPVIASAWRQVAKDRADADLKQSMIERGMSVEEIERVLRAKSSDK